jgi:MtrB/PioB family decaheme-associated outer membrane protein
MIVGLVACVINAGAVRAELNAYDFIITGDVELGGRVFIDRPSGRERGKFEEYRDIPRGIFLENLHVQVVDKDDTYFHEFLARDAVEDDQYYYFKSSKYGLYTLQFEWDQIPHVYATDSPLDNKISTRSDFLKFSLDVTPTPEWDVFADYQFIDKDGEKPRGAAERPFRRPDDAFDFKEFLERVEYNQHDMTLGTSYAQRAYQLQLTYGLSMFENDASSVIDPDRGGSSSIRGRLALPPDNMAHMATLQGGANLPYRTRINGTFSYGLRLQDDDLLPVSRGISGGDVPDFDGEVNTYLAYISSLSRPIDPLTIKLMYRFYKYDDVSDEIEVPFPQSNADLPAVRFPFAKHNAGIDAKWQFEWPISLILGYDWERWEREDRVSPDTNEHTPKLGLNATPVDWLFLGVTYSHSMRSSENEGLATKTGHVPPPGGGHDGGNTTRCAQCHFPGSGLPFPLFSNFNTRDRDRDKVEGIAEFTPINNLSFSVTGSLSQADYGDSQFGLQDDNDWSVGGDLTWKPWKTVALHASYLHEEIETRIRTDRRFLEVDIDPGRELVTDGPIDTVGAGVTVTILPGKLDWEAKWALSLAQTDFNTRDLPDLDQTYSQYATYLRYHFAKHWTAKIGYIFEDFDVSDAFARNIRPEPGDDELTSSYYEDYTAHLIVLGLAYHF